MGLPGAKRSFDRYLGARLRAARLRLFGHGLLAIGVLAGTAVLGAAWALGGVTLASVTVKIGLAACCVAVFLAGLGHLIWRPWRRLRDRQTLCRELEREESFANVLVAAEEACRRPDRWRGADAVGAELVRRLFALAAGMADRIELGRLLPLPWAARTLVAAVLLAAIVAGALSSFPERLRSGLDRLRRPWVVETYAPEAGLYLSAGPTEVVAGQSAQLTALDFGTGHQPVVCEVRSGSGLWNPVPCAPDPLVRPAPCRRVLARLEEVRESFAFRFRRDGLTTGTGRVAVRHPPLLTVLAAQIFPPAYTGLPPQRLPRVPSYLEVLAGSRLEWRGQVNHPVRRAAAVTSTGDTLAFGIEDGVVSGEVFVRESFSYSLFLQDEHGLENGSRLRYELAVIPDLDPIAGLQPLAENDGLLPLAEDLRLLAEAGDDFGVSEVDLLCRLEETGGSGAPGGAGDDSWRRLPVWRSERAPTEPADSPPRKTFGTGFGPLHLGVAALDSTDSSLRVVRELQLDTGDLDLIPGDVLVLCLEVRDNRRPGPPGRGRSGVLRFTLPSAADILADQVGQGEDRLADLEAIRRRSESLAGDLARLDRELKKDPLPDWARRQEMEEAVSRQKILQEELAGVAEQLQNDLAALAENHLTSAELVAKMDQVADLLAQIRNEELDRLLAALEGAVAKLSPEEIRRAIEEVSRNQQEMIRRLDRALALLKQLAQEQELEGFTSLLAEMIRQQQELLDENRPGPAEGEPDSPEEAGEADRQSEEAGAQESEATADQAEQQGAPTDEELARRQEALAEQIEQLEKQLQEAMARQQEEESAGECGPANDELQEALQKALQELAEQHTGESMREAARQLQEGQRSEASPPQQQALRDLAALYHVLLQSQLAMQMALSQFEVASLHRLAADLLSLSAEEEQIAAVVPEDLRDVRAGELTRRQFRVLKATRGVRDRLQALSTADPMQTLKLVKELDKLIGMLGQSVEGLEAGRGTVARRTSRQSLGAMNEIIIGLLTQAQMSGGGGSCSQPSLGQRLKQMAREQAGLNGLAERLRQQLQNRGLSQEIRARMERLETDQESLAGQARDLGELERQLQEGERLLGDVEELAREMEKVVQDFDQGLIDEQTLARQERILSRLLDMHNSARKRDFSARRESRTAQRMFDPDRAGELPPETIDSDTPFRLRYQPVEKAPLEYRELVRRYFQALEQLHQGVRPGITSGEEGRP